MMDKNTSLERISAQDNVILRNGWYDGQDETKPTSSCNSSEAKFLFTGFDITQETWPPERLP